MPVIANGVVRALSSVSDAFCGTTVALIVSPSTREMVSSSLRLRSKGISSVNMVFLRLWTSMAGNEGRCVGGRGAGKELMRHIY